MARLTSIDMSPQHQLRDPNKYIFYEGAPMETSNDANPALLRLSSVAHHPIKVLAIVIFGLSSPPQRLLLNVELSPHVRAHYS